MRKSVVLALVMAFVVLTPNWAVLKEKDLNQTISVLRAELDNSCMELQQQMARYHSRVGLQHQKLIEIMQRSHQVSLMLYSQKEDYTFDLSYACHEATEQYREFRRMRMPFDKILQHLNTEIERYDRLIEALKLLPPRLDNAAGLASMDSVDSVRVQRQIAEFRRSGIKISPFLLSSQSQKNRSACLDIAQRMRDSMLFIKTGIEDDKVQYSLIEKRLKTVNDYAVRRYAGIQKSIFINGGESYFEVLKRFKDRFSEARSDAKEKYQPESINTNGEKVKVNSQWRGPIVLFLALFILFYLAIASVLSGVIMKWLVPRRFRTQEFMKKKVCIMLVVAIVIFALVLSAGRAYMNHHNFLLMASGLLIEFAWLMGVILGSLLIRLKGSQIRSGFRNYTPIMLVGFVIITFRIIFIPNNVVNLIFPPMMLAFTLWQWAVTTRRKIALPKSDVAYTWISLLIMVVSSIASWLGYTLMAVQILIWWLFQLTCIQTITCLFDLLGLYQARHLVKKIKGILPSRKGKEAKAIRKEDLDRAIEKLKNNKGEYIEETWFFDFIYKAAVPIVGVISLLLSIWWSADVFDLTDSVLKLFITDYIDIPNTLSLSLQKIVLVASMWFLFHYLCYLLRALYRKVRKQKSPQEKQPNFTLANNIIAIITWGAYIIIIMLMLKIPAGAIETISAGLAAGVGFAMKGLLENFFYGISLMSGRVRVGDFIECDGVRGKVESITYQSTQLTTSDGSVIAFLNSALFSKNFKNLTKSHSYELVKIPVGVAYGTEVETVRRLLVTAIKNIVRKNQSGRDTISLKRPMDVVLNEFGDNSINLYFTAWVLVEDKFATTSRIKETIYNTLNKNNIEIPFPQRDVHIIK